MIEDMVDEDLGIISASRSYVCPAFPSGGVKEPVHLGRGQDGHLCRVTGKTGVYGEYDCTHCGRGPILWDHWRQLPYVLVPYVITEEIL